MEIITNNAPFRQLQNILFNKTCMKFFHTILILLFTSYSFGQLPESTNNQRDTSNYKYIRNQIKDEAFFIQLDSTRAEHYFNRGKYYFDIEELGPAIADFSKCISIAPNEIAPYYYRGGSFDRLKKFELAIIDFSKVIELKPDWEWGYSDRGMMYLEIEEYDKAEKDFKKAIELKVNWTLPLTNLGKLYDKKGDRAKAISYYKKAINADSSNYVAFNNLGFISYQSKEYESAIGYYNAAIEVNPNYSSCIRNRADAKLAKGDRNGACQDIKLAASLGDPKARAFIKKICGRE